MISSIEMKRYFITLLAATALMGNVCAQREITMEDLKYSNVLRQRMSAPFTSMLDGEHYAVLTEGKNIASALYKNGKQDAMIFEADKAREMEIRSIDGYSFSDDEQKILIWNQTRSIYRRSFFADYYVYDRHYNELKAVSAEGGERAAIMSPDGQMVAYVRDNNIYIKKLRYESTSAVTEDGEYNKVINGVPDWVYEEEFSTNISMAWSPDSKELAFIRYDESDVNEYTFPVYNGSNPSSPDYALYPADYSYKYPKAGEKNSVVSVKVYNVGNRTTKTMDIGGAADQYVPRIKWTNKPGELCILTLNRRQNELNVLLANSSSTVCRTLFTDRNERYVDETVLDNMMFLPDGKTMLYLGEQDGWSHIYTINMINGMIDKTITNGNYDVMRIMGYDSKAKMVYYQAARTSPMDRDIYAVTIDGKKEIAIATGGGTYDGVFSSNFKYLYMTYSDANTPAVMTVCDGTGKNIWTVNDNRQLRDNIEKNFVFHKKEFFSFTTADGITLNGWMVKPADFDVKKKYPVLMFQYSGPNSQQVLNSWSIDWEQVLASEGYIMACVDGRGTGARGEEFRKCTYLKLGKYESDDQIATAAYLGTLPYVDKQRIGIWGWSFGGFMTSLCMCKSNLFKMGIAVAPVTNWRFYDTVYTERFLRTPEENSSGYDDNSPIFKADQLSGKLLLIHGTADDNVHYQNQMEFVTNLIRSGKQFEMFTYPNKNHSIYGGNTRLHLYTMMLNYVKRTL